MAADCQWPSGLGPDTICFYFTVDVACSAEEVLVDLRTLFDQHGVRATFFVTSGPRPNFRRNSDTYRRLRETHGEIALADEDRVRPHRSSALAFAPEAKGLRAHSLYHDSAVLPLLPLYRRLGV
jgi:peptidoglycan/xylan/chitin deacetylase (PgdA/CDA1 family)